MKKTLNYEILRKSIRAIGRESPTESVASGDWDCFISHASEDKEAFVRPLAHLLLKMGVRVWYDEFTLSLGDSLSTSIDKGLCKSSFAVVVLSEPFFSKAWTSYELQGLVAREIGSSKVILPLWYNVDRARVLSFSPTLADKFAVIADNESIENAAVEIVKMVRPDLYTSLSRSIIAQTLWDEKKRSPMDKGFDFSKLKPGPIRHKFLPVDMLVRLSVLREGFLDILPQSHDTWVDNFSRDLHPYDELEMWEKMLAVHQMASRKITDPVGQKAILVASIKLFSMISLEDIFEELDEELHSVFYDSLMGLFELLKRNSKETPET